MHCGYPEIFLAVDNCFGSKRWSDPEEWLAILADIGIHCVEASADNECDPLYQGAKVLQRWAERVRQAEKNTGGRVVNLYSGHGTYATLGLGHPEAAVRRRMLEMWLKPMTALAGELDAGLGFFCHAFPERVLHLPSAFAEARERLTDSFAELAEYAGRCGCQTVGVEQMYSPHQIPWRINEARNLLREIFQKSSGCPFYLTIDVGHQCGQRRFLRPEFGEHGFAEDIWLGGAEVERNIRSAGSVDEAERLLDQYEYLFARPEDGNPLAWLEKLVSWSPIIHLQQSNGTGSPHAPFTARNNASGIVDGKAVLRALKRGFDGADASGMPPRCTRLYLTLELFSGTSARPDAILAELAESVAYWRDFIPVDGIALDKLVS